MIKQTTVNNKIILIWVRIKKLKERGYFIKG